MDVRMNACEKEYDFALILVGVNELTDDVANSLYEAGCSDATVSMRHGLIYIEFSRKATSLKEAIFSAIRNVRNAKIGADVLRIDQCNLVTQSEIARRIDRTRQLVNQYITGERGPSGFPPPECNLTNGVPLWAWCTVSYWLCQNDMIRPEDLENAEVVSAINSILEVQHQTERNPELIAEVSRAVAQVE